MNYSASTWNRFQFNHYPSAFSGSIVFQLEKNDEEEGKGKHSDYKSRDRIKLINPIVRLFICIGLFGLTVLCLWLGILTNLLYVGWRGWAGLVFFFLIGFGALGGFFRVLLA